MQILIFSDNKSTLKWINDQVVRTGYCSFATHTAFLHDAVVLLRSVHFDAIIYDVSFSGPTRKNIIRKLIDNHGQVPVIILTDGYTLPRAIEAVKMGARTYLITEKADQGILEECLSLVSNRKSRGT